MRPVIWFKVNVSKKTSLADCAYYRHYCLGGGGAVEIFNERNVEVVVGASGDAKTAVENYLKGDLKTTGSVCHEHQHHDECGE